MTGGKVRVKTAGSRTVNQTIVLVDQTSADGTDQSGLAYVDIPNDALLMAIALCARPSPTADGDEWQWEISSVPTMQRSSNGARGVLLVATSRYELATNGATTPQVNFTISFPDGLLLPDGTRVYLHQYGTNTKAAHKSVVLYLAEQD